MGDYSVSCDGVAIDDDGVMYSIAVYSDGEGFNSYVYKASDVADRQTPNVQTELLDVQVWLTSIWRSQTGLLYVTDADGSVRIYDGVGWTPSPASPQALTCIWGLSDSDVYAAGDEGVVYRWNGAAWSSFSPPLGDVIFCVRGVSSRNLYACGANGLLWHFDGIWTQIQLPTNQRLLGLLTLAANDALVCGAGGVLFRGADANWNDVSQPGHDFHSLADYRREIYLAGGGEGVFHFDGAAVANIKSTITSYRLVSNANYLASAGDVIAARFDGQGWFGARYS
ncbi:hypothetical protein [Mesorhizobium sp. WSM4906]|uniref:WD40/YVTN/BNR-like repeat-containing protein n=1 Tax=Mesorhizobium sp. WSM4906 TaxID=3038546 RepID=UPI0024165D2C|nr:hypothetical protein [Mesorhizobium sp. WSM4906]WFP75854.1 hypothetical protein QAZ22_29845 [Mesorhizobium sp. WSM4906]